MMAQRADVIFKSLESTELKWRPNQLIRTKHDTILIAKRINLIDHMIIFHKQSRQHSRKEMDGLRCPKNKLCESEIPRSCFSFPRSKQFPCSSAFIIIVCVFFFLLLLFVFPPTAPFPSPIQSTCFLFTCFLPFVSVHSICSRFIVVFLSLFHSVRARVCLCEYFFIHRSFCSLIATAVFSFVQLFISCKQKLIAGKFHSIFNFFLRVSFFLLFHFICLCAWFVWNGRLAEDPQEQNVVQSIQQLFVFSLSKHSHTHTHVSWHADRIIKRFPLDFMVCAKINSNHLMRFCFRFCHHHGPSAPSKMYCDSWNFTTQRHIMILQWELDYHEINYTLAQENFCTKLK